MALYRVRPTRADITIANVVSEYTNPATETIAEALTWGADEHVLSALAVGWWLYCRSKGLRDRRDSNHVRDDACHHRAPPSPESPVRPGAARSTDDPWPPPRRPAFGQALRRLSFRPCHPCRRAGIGRHRASAGKTQRRLVHRRRTGVDADRAAGALDQ